MGNGRLFCANFSVLDGYKRAYPVAQVAEHCLHNQHNHPNPPFPETTSDYNYSFKMKIAATLLLGLVSLAAAMPAESADFGIETRDACVGKFSYDETCILQLPYTHRAIGTGNCDANDCRGTAESLKCTNASLG